MRRAARVPANAEAKDVLLGEVHGLRASSDGARAAAREQEQSREGTAAAMGAGACGAGRAVESLAG